MRQLLSSLDRRALELIELLTFEDKEMTFSDLCQELNCTPNTLRNTFDYIRDTFSFLEISSQPYYFISYNNASIYNVYKHYLTDDVCIQIFLILLKHKEMSMDDLTIILNLSQSSIYRKIMDFNKFAFKRYGIKISSSPIRLKGKEINIRTFYSLLFKEMGYPASDIYLDIDLNVLSAFVEDFLKCLKYTPNFKDYSELIRFLTISILRVKNGYNLDKETQKSKYMLKIKSEINNNDNILNLLKNYRDKFDIEININNIIDILYIFLQDFYIIGKKKNRTCICDVEKFKRAKSYIFSNLKRLAGNSEVNTNEIDKLIFEINKSIVLKDIYFKYKYILDRSNYYFIDNLS